MTRLPKPTGISFLIALFLLGTALQPNRAWAGEGGSAETSGRAGSSQVASAYSSDDPGPVEMIIDGLVVRPLSFVVTVLGTVAFILTVPFSALGGNVGVAAEQLVVTPASYTFTRCLGCLRREYKDVAGG